ncbi:hypothetical protein KCU81_g71, partial [Aureobasidium melanogenum]
MTNYDLTRANISATLFFLAFISSLNTISASTSATHEASIKPPLTPLNTTSSPYLPLESRPRCLSASASPQEPVSYCRRSRSSCVRWSSICQVGVIDHVLEARYELLDLEDIVETSCSEESLMVRSIVLALAGPLDPLAWLPEEGHYTQNLPLMCDAEYQVACFSEVSQRGYPETDRAVQESPAHRSKNGSPPLAKSALCSDAGEERGGLCILAGSSGLLSEFRILDGALSLDAR